MSAPTPGWNPDPSGRHEYRYWDGTNWTDDVSDNGVTSIDPLAAAGGPGYPTEQAPTAPFEPTQAYGQGPAAPGYGEPSPPGGAYPPAGTGAYPSGPGGPGAPGGYGPYGTGGGLPPATPPKSGPPVGLLIGLGVLALAAIVVAVVLLTGGDDGDDDTATDDTTTTTAQEDATTTTAEETTTTTAATDPNGETQDVFALGVGDCAADSSLEGEVQEVTIIDCNQPHATEVFHSYLIPDGSLPDEAGINTIVEEQCLPAFQSFVGLDYYDSELEVTFLSPTQESWDAGDRELLCLIVDPAGDVTGTLAGANR
jgi:Septum formation/Protein of unknown function (DUF2510)